MIASVKSEMRSVVEYSLRLLEDRLANTEQRVAQLQADVGDLPARAAEFTRLKQHVDQVQNIFDMLAEQYYEAQIGESIEMGDVEIVDSAPVPIRPDPSNARRNTLLATILGLVLGMGLAFSAEHFDPRLRDAGRVERAGQLRVLAVIPHLRSENGQQPVLMVPPELDGASSNRTLRVGAEAFRMLRTTLRFAHLDGSRILTVTSSQPEEGKTTITVNLATSMAYQGGRVLLIDADLRRPKIHAVFGLDRNPGLSDLLAGEIELGQVVQRTGHPELFVISAGTPVQNPAELLGREEFAELLEKAASDNFTVLIDSPPTLVVADASIIGAATQGTLVVVRSEMTPGPALTQSVKKLRQLDVPLVGIVLNDASRRSMHRYGYYAYDKYYYSSEADKEPGGRMRGLLSRIMGRA